MLIFNLFTYIFTAITITTVRCDTSLGFLTHIVAHVLPYNVHLVLCACSLVADKLRKQDITAAGDALSSALFVATVFGLLIQAVLLVCSKIFLFCFSTLHDACKGSVGPMHD